ncbi:MAG TPA: ABC transporter permease [Chthoniobacterales bacterium]|nr:ABC transporter permease [Chthoniobacterales bacterium]
METTLRDIRYALRMLRKNPGFTITAVIALMLGIASTTVIFSVIDGVLLRPLPYPDADRILYVSQASAGNPRDASAPANYLDWAAQNTVFTHMAASRGNQVNLTDGDRAERVRSTTATATYFQVFGVSPMLGRTFLPSDEAPGNARVIVLSHAFWERRFGSDANVIGREIRINGEPHTIIGVMPRNFLADGYPEIWQASAWSVPAHTLRPTVDPRALRDSNYLDVWARLKPGVTLEQARAEMNGIMARMVKQHPNLEGEGIALTPLRDDLVGNLRPVLFVLFGAVTCLLLIGCANVANLQLARATARAREISIRAALGASRGRVIRQLLTESVLLALLGGALGVVLASWALPLLLTLAPADIRYFKEITLNREVLAFSLIASVLTGIVFGTVPAFHASAANPSESLGEGERGSTSARSRSRAILITVEVALSLVLLIGAGLMVKSFANLLRVDPGFSTERVLVFDLAPSSTEEPRQLAFYTEVLRALQNTAGIERVAAVSRLPFSGGNSSRTFNVIGSEVERNADIRVSSPDYFRTMGIPLLKGREFNEHDGPNSVRVAIINEACARLVFPNEDPLGKVIENFGPNNEKLQIVGVVGNVRHLALETAPRPELYQPLGQATWPRMFFAAKSAAANPVTVLPAVQSAVAQIDKTVALGNPRTMDDVIARSLAQRKFMMLLLAIFAGIAVSLATIGLYGVMSYSVVQRTREIGIRMALGAQRRDVLKLVVSQGMLLTLIGVLCGLIASLGATRLIANLLYGIAATDLATFIGLSLLLLAVALLACWLPARRASGVDPMVALRTE